MPDNQDITLKIFVRDPQGQFRGGTVDVEFKHRTLSDHGTQRGLDASREINIAGLRRAPAGDYKVTVTPTDVFELKSQFVNIPASGFATMKVTIDHARTPDPKPPEISFIVKGTVRTAAGTPFNNGLVRATHENASGPVLLGEEKTDNQGNYLIKYSSQLVTGTINLRVEVFDEQGGVLATSDVISPAQPIQQVDLVLKGQKPDDKRSFVVRGIVRDARGKPVVGVTVRAFDRDLRTEEPLGNPTASDKEGRYEIAYTAEQFARAEKGSADLRVAAFDPGGYELVTSKIIYNAQPEEIVELFLGSDAGRPSEYERLIAELTPILRDVPLHQLNETDIDFLAGDSGEDRQHIEWLARAANLAHESNSPTSGAAIEIPSQPSLLRGTRIPSEAFYGWFRLGLPTDWEALRVLPISTLRNALLAAIDQNIVPARLGEDVEGILARIPNPQKQELRNLLRMINLPPDRAPAIVTHADGIETISDATLTRLVEQNVLAPDEALSIGLGVSLHRLSGGEASLMSTMLGSVFPSVPNGRLQSARDLALLEPEDWERALGRAGGTATNGLPREQYARSLAMDAVAEFPHAAFVQRATRVPEGMAEKLITIRPLLAKNANAIALDFEALDLTGVNETDQQVLREAHTDLKRFANLHPGLGLHEVLSKQVGTSNTAKLVDERVGWLRTVFDLNQKVDFLNLDYLPDSAGLKEVKFGDLPKEARGLVLQDLKAHQRIFTVTRNAIPAREIMQAGFHSASAIALTRESDFAGQIGLANPEAQAYYATARDVGNEAAANWFRLYESARDTAMTPMRSVPSQSEFFKPFAGFQDLINSQPWCACAHCQSVLSPAAYFVDLMYYIEENILKDSFSGQENHLLHLRKRRSDLWDLELTCENTNDYVPYLDLVNEILERYVKDKVPRLRDAVPPADAEDLYKYLAEQDASFKQPFTLPIERLEILLEHFGLSRYDIAKAMGSNRKTQARARLKISLKEYDLINRERTTTGDLPFLKQLFKIDAPSSVASPDTVLDPLEMQTFLHATGLTHEIVEPVLKSRFVNTDGSTNAAIEVVFGKRNPADVQNNSELVDKVSLRRLDRIHRFVRLWRKLPWTVAELDYVLTQLAIPGSVSRIDDGTPGTPGTLERILDLLEVNSEWSLPIDELMALSGPFPAKGLREPTSLFDRLFNQAPFLDRDGRWPPNPAIRFTHPAWASRPQGVSSPNDNTLTRLLAGLQIGDKELVELIASLSGIPAIDHRRATLAPSPPSDESIALSGDSIGILFRHARLMRLLKSTMTDFIKLISLTPRIAERPADQRTILDLADVASVIEFAAWQGTSGFSLDEIIYMTGGVRPKGTPDPTILAGEIVARAQAEKRLEFADVLFTQLGLTDLQSRQIVLANLNKNADAFEVLRDGTYRLKAGFNPATTNLVTVDPPIDPLIHPPIVRLFDPPIVPLIDPVALRKLLNKYHALNVLDTALGSTLNLSAEGTKELRELAHPLDIDGQDEIRQAFLDGANRTLLTALVTDTLRHRALFKSNVFDRQGLGFVREHKQVFFGLPDEPDNRDIKTQVVINVAAYVALARATDTDFTTATGPADINAIQSVITNVGAASAENLAKSLRTDKTRIAALKPHLTTLPSNPFEALDVIARCLAFTEQLGVSGESLSLMVNEGGDTFTALSRAAEDVYGAFRAKYPNEKTFQEKIEPFEDKLRPRKRDGLVDFIVSKWPEPFADPNKLYEYFLIDVLLEGCARTSRVVAAISSLQLYVQRVLMNLERSNDWDGGKHGVFARFTDPDKQAEWYWRKHYRVWEANRKVFLYPENYIEPELRDDKTPLFKELEDTLLQQEISDANVHDSYAKYLIGFDEVARLKIAGVFYDPGTARDHHDDTLHLFGVTQDTPPVYYYRVINNTLDAVPRISAWQKLTAQIPVRKVSPIVFEGRLYVFWMETTTKPLNSFVAGSSRFDGYRHAVRIKYSTLRLDGIWTPPQSLGFEHRVATEASRIIDDPQTGRDEIEATERQIAALVTLERESQRKVVDAAKEASDARDAATSADIAKGVAENSLLRNETTALEAAEAGLGVGVGLAELAKGTVASQVQVGVQEALTGATPEAVRDLANALLGQNLAAVIGELGNWIGFLSTLASALIIAAVTGAPYFFRRTIALVITTIQAVLAADAKVLAEDKESRMRAALRQVQEDLAHLRQIRAEERITVRWDRSKRDHTEPLDNYKPEGWEWDRVYPDLYSRPNALEPGNIRLMLVPRNNPIPAIGAFQLLTSDEVDFSAGVLRQLPSTDPTTIEAVTRINNFWGQLQLLNTFDSTYGGQQFYRASFWLNYLAETGSSIALAPANSDMQVVNGHPASVIVESNGYPVWMRKEEAMPLLGARLGTTLTPSLKNCFDHLGASGILNAKFQTMLIELPPNISPVDGQGDPRKRNPFHPTNPFLTYFRETFFHIPFLVANHLNNQQKFAETQRWYHYIFNPTAADGIIWRYREFNTPMISQSLREMLTDPKALAAYRADPFNPHAIARTRLSAYQKSIVMKYIDNLLDWGDSLFSQFTMESVNEATMLYVMAQEILGPRPPVLGSCGEGMVHPKNYKTIRPGLNTASDFLIELELPRTPTGNSLPNVEAMKLVVTKTGVIGKQASAISTGSQSFVSGPARVGTVVKGSSSIQTQISGSELNQASGQYWTNVGGTPLKALYDTSTRANNIGLTITGAEAGSPRIHGTKTGNADVIDAGGIAGGQVGAREGDKIKHAGSIPTIQAKDNIRNGSMPNRFTHDNRGRSVYQTVDLVPPKNAVFCILPNKDLLAYWSRVEDRLFKIRNCMDIAGVRRHLELFAPEIDPRLLVRMKAAGLTLDDVLNSISGNVPPYRFTYLIDKAKQYASTLQSFGAQLLSAFEKRDGEELANLRAVHEHNLLKMRTRMTQLEIDAAEDAIEGLKRQKSAVEYRKDYFRSLSEVGLVASERTQQQHQRVASNFRTQASVVQFIAAILSIIPDVGAPTAMKFGGSQLGAAGRAAADGLNALAAFNEMSASMAGMEASNQRRDQDWKHQEEIAKRDISQIEKQITAAEIRRDIAVHSLEVHQKTIDQSEEMFEFFRNEKFTNINLYRLLSNRLQGLYRQAYNSALSMAKMTEQAYRAERTDDHTLLDGNYWDAGNAGLLAGERMLIDLQNLERQYLETNYRQLEIEQSFSLAQFSPAALLELRQSGECKFSVPEIFFDLTYPGHYRRRIKGVRLTIPCVTGPYTNVGATLRLTKSNLRADPNPSTTLIPEVPRRHTTSIAASTAQNDAGVFEFSFRDERYMPFEGAGAISEWELALPIAVHTFDYQTISDVILRINYTAEEDGLLRDAVQESISVQANNIKHYLSETGISQIFSLRHDFPDAWHRLVQSPVNTSVDLELTERHLPLFLARSRLMSTNVDILLQTNLPFPVDSPRRRPTLDLVFDTTRLSPPATTPGTPPVATEWTEETEGLPRAQFYKATVPNVTVLGPHTLTITSSGNLGSTGIGLIAAIDESFLTDILLKMTIQVAESH